MKLDEIEAFEKEMGLSAEKLKEIAPFDAYVTKVLRVPAKQTDRLDVQFEIVIPKLENATTKIRYTPQHIPYVKKFMTENGIVDLKEIIANTLVRFEMQSFTMGFARPIPTKIVNKE